MPVDIGQTPAKKASTIQLQPLIRKSFEKQKPSPSAQKAVNSNENESKRIETASRESGGVYANLSHREFISKQPLKLRQMV